MQRFRHGFTLLELSIVIAIIGLMAGGVLAGRSLIRAAQVQSIIDDANNYKSVIRQFKDQYRYLPGDMSNATSYWGTDTNCSVTYAGTTVNSGTCNGNGDGIVNAAVGASKTGETFQFWKQLALAGLVSGQYTGFSGPDSSKALWNGGNDTLLGQNAPQSRMPNGGWSVGYNGPTYFPNLTDGTDLWNYGITGNFISFGKGPNSGVIADEPLLTATAAFSIDSKLDDGKPGTGLVIAHDAFGYGNANSCTTSANNTDWNGDYHTTVTAVNCALRFELR